MAINFPHNPNINDVHTEASLGRSWKWDGTTWLIYSSSTTGIAFGDLSVVTEAAQGGGSLTYDNAGVFTFKPSAGGGGGATNFTGLGDTPSSLTAGKWLKVNVGGTALEWTDAPADTNTTYSLEALLSPGVKLTGSDITTDSVFFDSTGGISITRTTAPGPDGGGTIQFDTSKITVADESADTECYPLFAKDATGDIAPKTGTNIKFNALSGQLEAGSFKKTGGAAAEFLKADGSIDSNTYSQSNHTHSSSPEIVWTLTANGSSDYIFSGDGFPTGTTDPDITLIRGQTYKFTNNTGGHPFRIQTNPAQSGGGTQYNSGVTNNDASGASNQTLTFVVPMNAPSTLYYQCTAHPAMTGTINILDSSSTTTLGGLTDVDTTGAANGKILKYNGTSWEIADDLTGGGGSATFTGLSDTPSSLTAGKWLKVNAGATALEWTDAPSGDTTYDLSGVATSNGFKTRLSGSDSTQDDVEFTPGGGISYNVTGNTCQISSVNTISGLSDVSLNGSPSNGQVLKYNGSAWVNDTDATGGSSYTNSDVDTHLNVSGASSGQILSWNGSDYAWVADQTGGGGYTHPNHTGDVTSIGDGATVIADDAVTYAKMQNVDGQKLLGRKNTGAGVVAELTPAEVRTLLNVADTKYDLTGVATSNGAKIRLAGLTASGNTDDDIELTPGGGISYSVSGNTIQISSLNTLSGLSDTTITSSPTNGWVLAYDTGDSKWKPAAPSSGADGNDYVTNLSLSGTTLTAEFSNTSLNQSINLASIDTNTNTTYSISCIDGDNADEEKISLTAGGSGSGVDNIVLEAGTGLTIARDGDKITFTNSETDTKYDLSGVATSNGFKIRLAGLTASGNTNDDIDLTPGGGISYSVSGNTCQISSINSLSGLSDTDISSSPSTGDVLKWNGTNWAAGTDNSGGGADGNNYADSLSFNTGNGILTVGRSGLTDLTVDLDNRYAIGTIPTNNNQLTNGAGYITSSGNAATSTTATNANNVKIRTDNGAAWHYPLFVDSNSDNQNQTLKVDASGMKYYPSAGWLQNIALQSYYMYDWAASAGSAGQVLTSQGSGSQWSWTTPSSGGMTGNSKITVKTSGSGTHTTQSWCKTVVALAVGGGGGGGNAWYSYDDDDGLDQGRGGNGGSGGHKYYTASVSGATGISYSIGGGGSGQSQGSCDDNVANGAGGGSTTFGGVTAGGGGGGSGTWYGTGSNGANGSGDAIFFQTAYGAGGAGATGRSGDGCQGQAGAGTGGAVFILELG